LPQVSISACVPFENTVARAEEKTQDMENRPLVCGAAEKLSYESQDPRSYDPGAVPVPGGWHPRIPEQFDEGELADWRAGRDAAYQRY
jgi:hypothetical protein